MKDSFFSHQPLEVPDDLKDTTPWVKDKCAVCGNEAEVRFHGMRDVAAYGDETLARHEWRAKEKTPDFYGFYEEEYPIFSEKWEHVLQEPVTLGTLNRLVQMIRSRDVQIQQLQQNIGQMLNEKGQATLRYVKGHEMGES